MHQYLRFGVENGRQTRKSDHILNNNLMNELSVPRKKSNIRVLILYFAFAWLFPVLGLLVSLFNIEIEPFQSSSWAKATRLTFFFLTAPVYLVYLRLVLLKTFPRQNKATIAFFVPVVVTFLSYAEHLKNGIANVLLLDALPLFLGLNIVLLVGLFRLAVKDLAGDGEKIKRLPILLAFVGLYLMPVVFLAVYGWEINSIASNGNFLTGPFRLLVNVVLVVGFHSKIIKSLYQEGQL